MNSAMSPWYDSLWLQHPLDLDAQRKAKESLISTLIKRGDILELIGLWNESRRTREEALTLAHGIADKSQIASIKRALGRLFMMKGDHVQAMAYFEKSLEINQSLGDKRGISYAIGNMGIIYQEKGDYKTALQCYEKKLKISRELDDKRDMSRAVGNIGTVYYY